MRYAFISALVFLAGCASSPCTPTCIPLKDWSDVAQMNMKADIEQLPPDSELINAMLDYSRMRTQARACNGG